MISIDIRKKIFIKRFMHFESYRHISEELNIHRTTVTRICSSYQKKIKELNLDDDDSNLLEYIGKIVILPKYNTQRRRYKVNSVTKEFIKSLVKTNERRKVLKSKDRKSILQLFNYFRETINNSKNEHDLHTDYISYSCFYNIIREVKSELDNEKESLIW